MLNHAIKFLLLITFVPVVCFSTISSEKDKLMEELTGRSSTKKSTTVQTPVKEPLSKRHLLAGINAYKNKNYILALKHYNTVIIKHKNSAEVKLAYLEKVRLYNDMGLKEQAQRNSKLAAQYGAKKIVK